ncbi:nucleotidyl transferase AbiEii/AbiGii toxin family protein [Candidatus Shapirobacteria bacterium]|nr:nucleotidyl transferase AbiEii/AbiGii toxin family protein [Candidatus Shapirobacteria bacterium]
MIANRRVDIIHKVHLLRVLTKIVDNPILSQSLYFKGGTCASMQNILDRFSVDLDFDINPKSNENTLRTEFHTIFKKLDFTLDQESQNALEFFLKYKNDPNQRNTLKIDALNFQVKSNLYAPVFLPEINRIVNCQTKETIFANKLVAIKDRFDKHESIACRDLYDIHHFFMIGLQYRSEIIVERTNLSPQRYFKYLIDFIKSKITQTLIDQDLNTLLSPESFNKIRKILKPEVLLLLQNQEK